METLERSLLLPQAHQTATLALLLLVWAQKVTSSIFLRPYPMTPLFLW
jgi:hypothetical protein